MADEVYDIQGNVPAGARHQLLLDDWSLVDKWVDDTGLKAGLYQHPKTNELAVMFAGTEITNTHDELGLLIPLLVCDCLKTIKNGNPNTTCFQIGLIKEHLLLERPIEDLLVDIS